MRKTIAQLATALALAFVMVIVVGGIHVRAAETLPAALNPAVHGASLPAWPLS